MTDREMDKKIDALDKATDAVMRMWDSHSGFSFYDVRAALAPFFAPQQPAEPQKCTFKFDGRHGSMEGNTCHMPLDRPIHRKWDGDSREGAIDISHDFIAAEQPEPAKDDERKRS